MTDPIEILRSARTAVLHDWPSDDVPHALVLAGLDVTFQGGPDPHDLYVMRLVDGHPETSPATTLPERADIIYSHRPAAELPGLLAEARQLGAATLWHQSGRNDDGEKDPAGVFLTPSEVEHMTALADAAGVAFVSAPYIVAAAAAARS